jgi:pilus assembly protein FimV
MDVSTDSAPATAMDMDFDLDLGGGDSVAPEKASSSALDIDFDTSSSTTEDAGNLVDFDIAAPVTPAATNASVAEAANESGLDFNFDLGDASPAGVVEQPAPPLDLSSINLDLGAPAAQGAASADSAEVATKLELAQAYEEMGDREGARELLQEVLNEGSTAQQEIARSKLALLA